MAKHLVWDWNGTLLDDFSLVAAATDAVIRKAGGPQVEAQTHRERFRRPIIEYYSELLQRELSNTEFDTLDKNFHHEYAQLLTGCQLSAGARNAIDTWTGTQSLLSMWFHNDLVPLVNHYGLAPSFSRIDGLKQRTPLDTKQPHLETHLNILNINPTDCVLIGDSVDDAQSALAIGAQCILYSGGFTSPHALAKVGVPVVDTLSDAVALAATTALPQVNAINTHTHIHPSRFVQTFTSL